MVQVTLELVAGDAGERSVTFFALGTPVCMCVCLCVYECVCMYREETIRSFHPTRYEEKKLGMGDKKQGIVHGDLLEWDNAAWEGSARPHLK